MFCLLSQNTFILKRRWIPLLNKTPRYEGERVQRRLKPRTYIYDLVEDTNVRSMKPLEVLLLEDVEGIM